MYKLAPVLGLFASAVLAAETTTTLLLLGFDQQSIVGSVIGSDSTATTYALSCPSGEDGSDCGVPPNFIITQGPSTMHYEYSYQADDGSPATVDAGCSITSDHGYCTSVMVNAGPSMVGGSGTAFPYSNFGTDIGAQAVTILQGGAAASNPAASNTGAAKTTASAPAQTTGSQPGATSAGAHTTASANGGSSSSTSSVSKAAAPMITGPAQWLVGGAGAAIAMAAVL